MNIWIALFIGYAIRSCKDGKDYWLYVGPDESKYDKSVIGFLTKGSKK